MATSLTTRIFSFFVKAFKLPTKPQLVDIAKRVVVTFGSVFTGQLALAEAQIVNISTARIVIVAAAGAAANAVYRLVLKPELVKVETQFVPLNPQTGVELNPVKEPKAFTDGAGNPVPPPH